MNTRLSFQPILIIGAARSGTNILRDVMTSCDGLASWDCDEINAIWRYGNLGWPNDALPPALATPAVKKFIRRAFLREWQGQGQPKYLVEKTCANTLRIPFVRAVLPEARFVHLQRNGVDVTTSAMKRWSGAFELNPWRYYLAKLRYVPLACWPHFATQFIARKLTRGSHFKTWGPIPEWMPLDAPLEQICARQWASCATRAARDLAPLPPQSVHHLQYEALIRQPYASLRRLFLFLNHPISDRDLCEAIGLIRQPQIHRVRNHTAPLPEELAA